MFAFRRIAILALFGQVACAGDAGSPTKTLKLSALSIAVESTCGLDATGAAFCWGQNAAGELGDGTRINRTTPVPVVGGLTFTSIVTGGGSIEGDGFGDHTCALTAAGAAYCWGQDVSGELGVPPTGANPSGRASPVQVAGFSFTALAAGNSHTCGLTAAGAVLCWGANSYSQLGDGTTTSHATPAPISGALVFQSIVAGGDHTCGLTAAGDAYCWGMGAAVGDSSFSNRSTPTLVFGGLHFVSLAAGGGETGNEHTCGITIDQTVYCWGYDGSGALGAGAPSSGLVPVAVAGGLKFSRLSAAQLNTCGITTGGDTFCWGAGFAGQLNNGLINSTRTPILFSSTIRFQSIAVGAFKVCGISLDGTVYCTSTAGLVPVTTQ